jgi:L-glyceraldehyde 3-phosphate reductase
LGLWQNFGGANALDTQRAIILEAFDLGVTHYDLANNYGPPAGSAEENFGRVVAADLRPYRDEIVSPPRRATTCTRVRTASGARGSTC